MPAAVTYAVVVGQLPAVARATPTVYGATIARAISGRLLLFCCRLRRICGIIKFVKVIVLYRPNSDHARAVESFVRDFERQHDGSTKLELTSVNTRDGAAMASLYDIMAYPSILALADDGSVLNTWIGPDLPLMADIASYMYA